MFYIISDPDEQIILHCKERNNQLQREIPQQIKFPQTGYLRVRHHLWKPGKKFLLDRPTQLTRFAFALEVIIFLEK